MAANWKRSDEAVWEELGSDMVVVSPRSGCRYWLNATAAAIWKMCDGSRSAREVAQMLSRTRAEIVACCEALQGAGLLSLASGGKSQTVVQFAGLPNVAPEFRVMGLTGRGGRRPTPRGNSGPG